MEIGAEAQIPEKTLSEITSAAAEFFEEFWGDAAVGIDEVCDELGIGIVLVPGLKDLFGMEAYTTYDFRKIVIDEHLAANTQKFQFLVAHELGHIVMHKEYYPSNIYNTEEYLKYVSRYINGPAEEQAELFAKELLKNRGATSHAVEK